MTIKVVLAPGKRYQYLYVDGNYIAGYWGEVTKVELRDNKYHIELDTDGFLNNIDEIAYRTINKPLELCIEELLKKEVA